MICDVQGHNHVEEISFRHVEEYPIVQAKEGLSVTGKPKSCTNRIDYVYLIEPGVGAIYHNRCYTVGVEIKSSFADLENIPEQLMKYQGHCDYFFVAVSNRLVGEVMRRVRCYTHIGVFSYESGLIFKFPEKMCVSNNNRMTMLYRMLLCPNQETKQTVTIEPGTSLKTMRSDNPRDKL